MLYPVSLMLAYILLDNNFVTIVELILGFDSCQIKVWRFPFSYYINHLVIAYDVDFYSNKTYRSMFIHVREF